MLIYQETIEQVEKISGKDYEGINYSNNGESEYAKVYSDFTVQLMLDDLLEEIERLQGEIEHLNEVIRDNEQYYQDNWKPIHTSTLVRDGGNQWK